ncbi:hypothetical protein GpartN1_g5973.t1 [Galdieria partita]|uniref:STIL N-terminal domain-containing protein n=1 Tax=Galdieria partita TaxID=83374 RepID=A0A9C7USZ4_9RHOD|nr:hypothetical protein GpartN1_g5973.t1 [Galdieria partita]
MNFPRVRSILWDTTPDKEGEDAASSNIETIFTISPEHLLSSEWVWKPELVGQLRELLRQRKQNRYFVTVHETWCETGNLRIFARKLLFEAVSDNSEEENNEHQRTRISLLMNDSETLGLEKMKFQGRKPIFRSFWLCELFKYFPPRIEMDEHGNDILLCLRIHIPDVKFVFTKIPSPRVHNMEVIHHFVENFQEKKNEGIELYSMIDNFGFLSMNSVRKLLLYRKDDPDILERQPVVGFWMFVKDRLDPAMLWMSCYNFLLMEGLYERVLQNGSFLVLLYHGDPQKYSILCCNCEAQLGRCESIGQLIENSSSSVLQKVSLKAFSCHFSIPDYTVNTDITGYLGLPVKIYRLTAMSALLDRRKFTYSSLGKQSNHKNSEYEPLPTWKDNGSSKSSVEDYEEGKHEGGTEQVESKKYNEQQDPTTRQQLQRLYEEMETLKKYFRRLGVTPEYKYQESTHHGMNWLSGKPSKLHNHTRRPRSSSQEDISEDSVFTKLEVGTGHIMSPVSSATDGDPKNEMFPPPKATTVPPTYGRQLNNSWLNKPRAKNRIDVAVQVDSSGSYNRNNSHGYEATRNTLHVEETHSKGFDETFKVNEQVVTDDLKLQDYSRGRLESSVLQDNFVPGHRHSSPASSFLSPCYKNFGDTKNLVSSYVDIGQLPQIEARVEGCSESYPPVEPRRSLVNVRKKRSSCEQRQLNKQSSTSSSVELDDDSGLTVPNIIYTGLSDDEDYDHGYSS